MPTCRWSSRTRCDAPATGVTHPPRYWLCLTALLLPGLLTAQGRDSAGVRIIESTTPQFTGARAWRLSPQPVLSLGAGLPDAADEIMLSDAPIELSDGRFVISHARTNTVRFYTRAGALQHTVGRRGEGPNEFNGLMRLFSGRGDTVVIHDGGNSRLTWIGPNGTIARMIPFRVKVANIGYSQGGMLVDVPHIFPDGRLALTSSAAWPGLRPPRPMQFRDSLLVLHCVPTNCTPTPIVRTAGMLMFYTNTSFQSLSVAFGDRAKTAFSGGRIFVTQRGQAAIEEYGTDGKLRRITRLLQPRRPITAAFLEARRKTPRPADWDKWSARRQAIWNTAMEPPDPPPAFFQAFSALFADREGGVYALESDDPTQPKTLAAFSPTGAFLARIPIPDGIMIRSVSRDIVYATRDDDDGFTHLMLYRILKP